MSQQVKHGSGWLLGLMVALALAFGAKQAMASPVQLSCMNDGWNFLGSCTSEKDCLLKCQQVHGTFEVIGRCRGGCCSCLF